MPIEPPIGPKPPIGRGWLIDQITALVDRGGLGLLTLTGLPGVGKTTVARCALDRRAHRWIDADDLARRLPPADVVGVGDVVVVDGVTDDEAQRAAIEQLLDRGVRLVATVMHHAAAIYRKLQVRGRGEAGAWWFRQRP